ncbi:MAG: aspartate-semialdehyde dehydrogenase [Erythrobacter sp.]|nr:aspartate-semialdehyde dehydrogenase [Erythrobacter sp.]
MRLLVLTVAAMGLAACDSGEVPSPTEQQALRPPSPELAADAVELNGNGLAAGSEAFYFAAGRAEVETALAGVLGQPTGTAENDECGAGPMQFTDFPGGLTVNFQDGSLVGWLRRPPQDGDSPAIGSVSVGGDVRIGTSREDAEASGGLAIIEGSTLGEEFALGERIGGFFEEDSVSMLYAGTQCFFR